MIAEQVQRVRGEDEGNGQVEPPAGPDASEK
jgi:hypothetical protein